MSDLTMEFKCLKKLILKIEEKKFDFESTIEPDDVDLEDFKVNEEFEDEEEAENDLREHLEKIDTQLKIEHETAMTCLMDFYEEYIDNMQSWCFEWLGEIVSLVSEYRDNYENTKNGEKFSKLNEELTEVEEEINDYIKELTDDLAEFKKYYYPFYEPSPTEFEEILADCEYEETKDGFIYTDTKAYEQLKEKWNNDFVRISTGEDAVKNNLLKSWESSQKNLVGTLLNDISCLLSREKQAEEMVDFIREGGYLAPSFKNIFKKMRSLTEVDDD